MEERTILNENGVTVTNVRFIVPQQTYAMSGVTSVKEFEEKPSLVGPAVVLILGLVTLFANAGTPAIAVVLLVVGGGWLLARIGGRQHHVMLSTAGGETKALSSKDREWIRKVVRALNDSIVARG